MATKKPTTKKSSTADNLNKKLSSKLSQMEEEIIEVEEEEVIDDEDIEEVEAEIVDEEDDDDEDSEEVEEEEIIEENDEDSEGEEEYISDTFQELTKDIREQDKKSKSNKIIKMESTSDLLKDISVDLNNIIIDRDTNELEVFSIKDEIFNSKATFQVVACQSGYVAQMSALKNQELQNIANADSDLYNFKKNLYKHLHKHIESSSYGKMGFEEFQRITSYFDIETLLYGIYCQTFPYENRFQTRCNKPDCGEETSVLVNNDTLVEIRGDQEDTYANLQKIINSNNTEELIQQSLVHKIKRVCLDESKIIFDLVIPSVYDYLERTLKNVNPQFMNDYSDSIGLNLFVDKIFIPNIHKLRQTGKLSYIEQTDKTARIMTIADLSFNDNIQLSDEITKFTDKYKISYSIKNVRCKKCGDIMDPIPVSMEEVLFRRIRLGRQESQL